MYYSDISPQASVLCLGHGSVSRDVAFYTKNLQFEILIRVTCIGKTKKRPGTDELFLKKSEASSFGFCLVTKTFQRLAALNRHRSTSANLNVVGL